MSLDKYHLNLAGEYRVCAELLKRGLFATITYGNKKGADVYAIGPSRKTAVIEVKASNSNRFVTGFYQKYRDELSSHPDFWVLYSVKPRHQSFDEQFFVLTHGELATIQGSRNHPGQALTYEQRVARVTAGVDNVLSQHVVDHADRWDKIIAWCSEAG